MSQAIIRGIWGAGKGHSDEHIERTVRKAAKNKDPIDKVYCFGKHNKRILERCGYKPDMLDSQPIASPRMRHNFRGGGIALRWGVAHWWHKFKILEAACQEFDHVLWQDFDCQLMQKLPPDFWDELKSGASIRAPLTIQLHGGRGAWWRIPYDERQIESGPQPKLTQTSSYEQARIVPAGGYIYIRGASMGRQLMTLQNEHLKWNSQPILALFIDQMYQGWPGPARYVRDGHEVRGYFYGASLNRPRWKQTYWMSGVRKIQWHARRTRHFWRWPPCSDG